MIASITLDCIYLKNLACSARIGLYDYEKNTTQPLILHLELYGKWVQPDFLDYDQVVAHLQSMIARQHYDLLEQLAEILAQTLLATFPIQKLVLAIDKPQAVKNALVGVKIERFA